MKKAIFLILLIYGTIVIGYGQSDRASRADIREQRRYERQKRQEENAAEREKRIVMTRNMVGIQRFVLEANYLSNKYGVRVPVSPTINFIMVDSLEGIIQFGSAYSLGYNGVGGETLDGRITKYEYTMMGRKKDSYSIRTVFMSPLGTYDITLLVTPDGYADATIRGNWSGQLNYHGKLVPLGLSKIYKGHPRY